MNDYNMAPDVVGYVGFIFTNHPTALELSAKHEYAQIRSVSDYLDAQHFTNGDLVADTANSCIPYVYTNVSNPRMFVIHNDTRFPAGVGGSFDISRPLPACRVCSR